MRRVPVLVLTVLTLLLGHEPSVAQYRSSGSALELQNLSADAPQPLVSISSIPDQRRAWWIYPAVGVAAGALVGGLWGQHTVEHAIDYSGPVLWPYTAAAGGGVGFLLGVLVNGIFPR